MPYYVDGIRCDTAEEARRLRDSRRETSAPQTFDPVGRDALSIPGHPSGCSCDRCDNYRIPLHY